MFGLFPLDDIIITGVINNLFTSVLQFSLITMGIVYLVDCNLLFIIMINDHWIKCVYHMSTVNIQLQEIKYISITLRLNNQLQMNLFSMILTSNLNLTKFCLVWITWIWILMIDFVYD